jgi:hypothetical protein
MFSLALLIDMVFLFCNSIALFTIAGEHLTLYDSLFYLMNLSNSSLTLSSSSIFLLSISPLLFCTYASNFLVVAGFYFSPPVASLDGEATE